MSVERTIRDVKGEWKGKEAGAALSARRDLSDLDT